MDYARKIELIDKQIADAKDGFPENFSEWRNKTEVVVRTIFGEDSPIHKKLTSVKYSPTVWISGMDTSGYRPAGVRSVISILNAAKLELDLANETPAAPITTNDSTSQRVFIVHGQDDKRKYELESYLQKLVREAPVILHQQPNGGRVLIEKFEDSAASVGYAIVLLTADDVGRPATLELQEDRARGRQNVVFEMGFFIGLIGRARVAVLYDEGVELPSDINGLVYIPLDSAGAWKGKLASELDHATIAVDWSAVGRS